MRASELLQTVRKLHPDEELECIVVRKEDGTIVTAEMSEHANSMQTVLDMFKPEEVENVPMAVVRAYGVMVDKLLAHCKVDECMECSTIVCPHGEMLHLHHDGCPSCDYGTLAEYLTLIAARYGEVEDAADEYGLSAFTDILAERKRQS